ncbi:hypothetical protein CAter282_0505 [Collimonas arenae]|uniref:Uncharacterized protein n=1 Tax=Collimonas arenae TaxID=279058 RepID=A0A127PKV7_9BURK|nr:hypothetical protein CAter10_0540 [Collimonas arenae]AMP08321.1 hypothetical protein CAter282_0505 [Collimonas arenae]
MRMMIPLKESQFSEPAQSYTQLFRNWIRRIQKIMQDVG